MNVEERVARAREYFQAGYNCCQAVVLAYADMMPADNQTLATIAAPFGGGMGRMREVCGTVSGMTMVAGAIEPAPSNTDPEAKRRNYALVQKMASAFRNQNGSIICRELLGLEGRDTAPTPSARTEEYYRKRPCVELVGIAARIVGEELEERGR